MRTIRLFVNQEECTASLKDPGMTLLDYLRNTRRLTAAKKGCGEGHCGSCTVLIDGKPSLACMRKMEEMEGRAVETLEALSSQSHIHAIQFAFLKHGAFQCGFCTPGMIMATKGLLDKSCNPTESEIRQALRRNLCRCTGYVKIIQAVEAAATFLRAGKKAFSVADINPSGVGNIGTPVPQVDGLAKVTGRLQYADDLFIDNMLCAKVLRSEYAHAKLLKLNLARARNLEGVVGVLMATDIPGKNSFGVDTYDQPILADRQALWVGEAIAVVVAETEAIAEKALSLIDVKYRPYKVLQTPREAAKSRARCLHSDKTDNLLFEVAAGRGDVVEGIRKSDVVLRSEYQTPFIEHAYLEPESCVAVPESGSGLTVHVASQGPTVDARQICRALNISSDKLRIVSTAMGGGFGGKEDITVQIIAALAASKTGRPVKLTLSRRESIRVSTKRHAFDMKYTTGTDWDGRITGVDALLISDNGAYASVGKSVLLRAASFACGPYCIANAQVKGKAYLTNNNPAGAMRGYGNPQVTFASEVQLNRLAQQLGIGQFEIRLRNVLDVGSTTITGERLLESVGVRQCLLAVKDALSHSKLPKPSPGWRIGYGVAASYKNVGIGIGFDDPVGAYAEITEDGFLLLRVGSVDMGQGAVTTMAQIASERLNWPFRKILVHCGDTSADPSGGMTTASKQTFLTGKAVYHVVDRLRDRLIKMVARQFCVKPAAVSIVDESFIDTTTGKTLVTLSDAIRVLGRSGIRVCAQFVYSAPKTKLALSEPASQNDRRRARLHNAYCFGAQAFIVEAEEASGRVNVLKVIAASDVGRAINPQAIEGQMQGGIVMGIGYALSEQYKLVNGQIVTDTLAKLGLRRIDQTPDIQCIIVEDPHSEGPFGAKGMGELPVSMAAPAIVTAINDALGVWVTSLPATPEKILAALKKRGSGNTQRAIRGAMIRNGDGEAPASR